MRILRYDSGRPGPHLLVFGAIHGNEVCGPRAIDRLAGDLDRGTVALVKGRCTFVPICNPEAHARNVRYVDENLNRVFEPIDNPASYERRLARDLMPLIDSCDALLDLHSTQSRSPPFVFLNRPSASSEAFCRALGTGYVVRGWPEVYKSHPQALAACTQTYADQVGKTNALIECGRHATPEADEVAYLSLHRALAHFGLVLDQPVAAPEPRVITLTELFFRLNAADRFAKDWETFEPVAAGALIGHRADGTAIHSAQAGCIVFPSPISAVGTEWFYLARDGA